MWKVPSKYSFARVYYDYPYIELCAGKRNIGALFAVCFQILQIFVQCKECTKFPDWDIIFRVA